MRAADAVAARARAADELAEIEADLDRVDDPHAVERLRRRRDAQLDLIRQLDWTLERYGSGDG